MVRTQPGGIVLALLALSVAGCGGPGGTPSPPVLPPTPGSSAPGNVAAPAPPPSAPGGDELATFRGLVEQDAAVKAALALTGRDREDTARRLWQAGRESYRRLAARHDLKGILDPLARGEPTPEVFDELGRLSLIERLLTWTEHDEGGPLFEGPEAPALARALARGVAVRREPAMEARRTHDYRLRRERYMQLLGSEGRSWKTLRRLEDFYIAEGAAKGYNSRFRRQAYGGEPYRDPTEEIPTVVLDGIYRDRDRQRLVHAPDRFEMALAPPAGDLFLGLGAWNLFSTSHIVLELMGREQTVRVVVSKTWGRERDEGLPGTFPTGYAVRIRRQILPAGLRKLVARIVGLQPIGKPEPTANLAEILMLESGPPPEVFRDHGWLTPQEPPPLDELARQRLDAALEPLFARLRAAPDDPEPRLGVAVAFLEAGRAEPALQYLQAANSLRPDHAQTLSLMGRALWALGDAEEAEDCWVRSFRLDPKGPARGWLEKHFPALARQVYRIASAGELLAYAAARADFRRQGEIGQALAHFAARKGVMLRLEAANSASLIADLHKKGWLARPGGPPVGRGLYLTDEAGGVYSSELGSREDPKLPTPALLARLHVEAPAEVVLAALAGCRPEAWEFGLPLLADAALPKAWAELAGPCRGLGDPWALDVVLARLGREIGRGEAEAAKAALPFLKEALARERGRPAWLARGLLHELGVRGLPALAEADLDPLLLAVWQRQVPLASAWSALDGLGAAAKKHLLARLKGPSAAHFAMAVELLPRVAGKAEIGALIAAMDTELGGEHMGAVLRALRAMAGRDLGLEPAAWRTWWKGGGR